MEDGSDILRKPFIRPEHLLEAYLASKQPLEDHGGRQAMRFGLWVAVVKYWMGEAWVMRHLDPGKASFLRLDETNEGPDAVRRNLQVWDLAELVLNLQRVDGFRQLMRKMYAARERDIESLMGELRVARLLYINGHRLRFIEASGVRKIHDLEITLDDGTVVHGETKCKITATALQAKTIENALKKAAKQFTGDVPGVIFVHFPQEWYAALGVDETHGKLKATAEAFFSQGRSPTKPQHTRVVAAVFYCESLRVEDLKITQGHDFAIVVNPWHRFDRSRDWRLLHYMPPPGLFWTNLPVPWIRLDNPPASILKHVGLEIESA